MKKYWMILCLIGFFSNYTTAQPSTRQAGSAYQLKGKVYTLVCFITTPDKSWTTTEKTQILTQVKAAQSWLASEAICYNVNVSFEIGTFGLNENIVFPIIESGNATGKERVDWVSRVLEKVGYKRPLDFYEQTKKRTQAQNVQVLVVANSNGRSYSMAYSTEMDKEKYFVEGSILYRKTLRNGSLYTASIAHEMLHLYGAWDLYATFNQSADREQYARKLFPNDIMLKVTPNVQELGVWELTAWLIGWKSSTQNWYNWFKPKGL